MHLPRVIELTKTNVDMQQKRKPQHRTILLTTIEWIYTQCNVFTYANISYYVTEIGWSLELQSEYRVCIQISE